MSPIPGWTTEAQRAGLGRGAVRGSPLPAAGAQCVCCQTARGRDSGKRPMSGETLGGEASVSLDFHVGLALSVGLRGALLSRQVSSGSAWRAEGTSGG